MKALIYKETLQHYKVAVYLELAIIGFTLFFSQWDSYSWNELFTTFEFVCFAFMAMASIAMGIRQSESGRSTSDGMVAFLTHRPVSLRRIFWSKAVVGIGLIQLSITVPFFLWLGIIAWMEWQIVPFSSVFIQAYLKVFLCGIPIYFMGLTGRMQETRWRLYSGFTMLLVLISSIMNLPLGGALLVILSVTGVTAWISWRSFYPTSHPSWQQSLANGLVVSNNSLVVLYLVILLKIAIFSFIPEEGEYYVVTPQGSIFSVSETVSWQENTVNSLKQWDHTTQKWIKSDTSQAKALFQETANTFEMHIKPKQLSELEYSTENIIRNAMGHTAASSMWYYSPQFHYFQKYGPGKPQYFGPHGFTNNEPNRENGFEGVPIGRLSDSIVTFRQGIYAIHFEEKNIIPLLEASDTNAIIENPLFLEGKQLLIVPRKNNLEVYRWSGGKEPFETNDLLISIENLYNPNTFFTLQTKEASETQVISFLAKQSLENPKSEAMFQSHIAVVTQDGQLVTQQAFQTQIETTEHFSNVNLLITPIIFFAMAVYYDIVIQHNLGAISRFFTTVPSHIWVMALVLNGLTLLLMRWLLNQYAFSRFSKQAWLVASAFLGPISLLSLYVTYPRSVTEPCHQCGKPRFVQHPHCRHCQANFAPPVTTGTEIFI